jgi:hypothetical protein
MRTVNTALVGANETALPERATGSRLGDATCWDDGVCLAC